MARSAGAFSSLCLSERDFKFFTEFLHCFAGFRITNASAYDHQRFFGSCNDFCHILQFLFHCSGSGDPVHSLFEEIFREIKGFALHILAYGDAAGAGLCRIRQHPHGVDQSCHNHLWSGDPVPIFAHRFKGIVGADCQTAALLQLLQHRIRLAGSKGICRKYQKRNVVYGSSGAGCHHIGCAGTDGRRTGNDFSAVVLLGKSDCRMAHTLLISSLEHPQLSRIGIQRLS